MPLFPCNRCVIYTALTQRAARHYGIYTPYTAFFGLNTGEFITMPRVIFGTNPGSITGYFCSVRRRKMQGGITAYEE